MHRLNKEFDRVICINLAERKDKKEDMELKFEKLGIEVEWFTAVQYGFIPKIVNPIVDSKVGHFNKKQSYEIGAALSHYHVIKQSILEGAERLFVFEDDVRFHVDFNEKLNKYFEYLPDNWDMILLYSFMYELLPQNQRISKRWMRSYRSWSLMSYGMKLPVMKDYISRQDKFFTISDLVTYRMEEDSKFNIYSAVPALCIPKTEMGSNIRGENMNYNYNPSITQMGYGEKNYE